MLRVLAIACALFSTGCFLTRSGTISSDDEDSGVEPGDAGMDAAEPDTGVVPEDAGPPPMDSHVPYDANCAPGTVDLDGDPTNGCECEMNSPPTERCNGRDDDCDPTTFDGSGDSRYFQPCDGPDDDRCEDGTWVCNVDEFACTDPLEDTFEMCGTGVDEDCDGMSDESSAIGAMQFYRDADSDMYGDGTMTVRACEAPPGFVLDMTDCDDTTPGLSPGVMEVCNGADENCSGLADDGAGACPCAVVHRGTVPYMFCTAGVSWAGARDFCASYGYVLVRIEEDTENNWVSSAARSVAPGTRFWVGVRQSNRTRWEFVDASRATYLPWGSGQPDDGNSLLVTEDCIEINAFGDARWNDYQCDEPRGFICEWP